MTNNHAIVTRLCIISLEPHDKLFAAIAIAIAHFINSLLSAVCCLFRWGGQLLCNL